MLYLDMDGVLADFEGMIKKLVGEEYSTDPVYSFQQLATKDHPFFFNMPVLPDAVLAVDRLVHTLGEHQVQILTSLPKPTGNLWTVRRDKIDWFSANFGHCININTVEHWSLKSHFCFAPADVLVDDSERNCNAWIDSGGIAVLHKNWDNTMQELEKIYKF